MNTYIVRFERTTNHTTNDGQRLMMREVAYEEVEAAAYVPLPQKLVNFYKQKGNDRDIVATFYDVVSVTLKP